MMSSKRKKTTWNCHFKMDDGGYQIIMIFRFSSTDLRVMLDLFKMLVFRIYQKSYSLQLTGLWKISDVNLKVHEGLYSFSHLYVGILKLKKLLTSSQDKWIVCVAYWLYNINLSSFSITIAPWAVVKIK